jgi:hypothetical protein
MFGAAFGAGPVQAGPSLANTKWFLQDVWPTGFGVTYIYFDDTGRFFGTLGFGVNGGGAATNVPYTAVSFPNGTTGWQLIIRPADVNQSSIPVGTSIAGTVSADGKTLYGTMLNNRTATPIKAFFTGVRAADEAAVGR